MPGRGLWQQQEAKHQEKLWPRVEKAVSSEESLWVRELSNPGLDLSAWKQQGQGQVGARAQAQRQRRDLEVPSSASHGTSAVQTAVRLGRSGNNDGDQSPRMLSTDAICFQIFLVETEQILRCRVPHTEGRLCSFKAAGTSEKWQFAPHWANPAAGLSVTTFRVPAALNSA